MRVRLRHEDGLAFEGAAWFPDGSWIEAATAGTALLALPGDDSETDALLAASPRKAAAPGPVARKYSRKAGRPPQV